MFNIRRNCQIFSQNACASLHSPWQCMKMSGTLDLHQHLLLLVFFVCLVILVGMYSVSLQFSDTYDVTDIFICLLAVHISSLVQCLFKSFLPITKTELPIIIDLWEFPIYSGYKNFVIYGLETFPSSMWLTFTVS